MVSSSPPRKGHQEPPSICFAQHSCNVPKQPDWTMAAERWVLVGCQSHFTSVPFDSQQQTPLANAETIFR